MCSVDGCGNHAGRSGMCPTHYRSEWRRQRNAAAKADSPTLTCQTCGATFKPQRYHHTYQPNRFCSRRCKEQEYKRTGKQGQAMRRWQFKTKYGITPEEYQVMLVAQGGGCAICGTAEPVGRVSKHGGGEFWLHVDHDHQSGDIRGLLCNECNTGLGKFRDDVQLLRAAFDYLAK